MVQSAIAEIKVNEILVWHAELGGQGLEVGHSSLVQAHRDRLFQGLDIRVSLALHISEIVVVSHGVTFRSSILPLLACRPCAQK